MPLTARSPLLGPRDQTPFQKDLPRSLTFIDGLSIVIGIQIGSGIFTSPSTVTENIPNSALSLSVWLLAGFIAWTGAACFVELGALIPRNGGIQEYLRYCYNDGCACIATWTLLFIVKPCSIALVSNIFAEYLLKSFNSDSIEHVWYIKLIAVAAAALLSFINCLGTHVSARIANFFLFIKVFGLLLVIATGMTWGLYQAKDRGQNKAFEVPSARDITPPGGKDDNAQRKSLWRVAGMYTDATLAAMWAYSGWETLGYLGGEVIDARRNIPRILNSAMAIVIVLYVLANMAYTTVLPLDTIKKTDTIAMDFGRFLFGKAGEIVFCWIVVLSCLGALDIKILTLSRLTQAALDRNYLTYAFFERLRFANSRPERMRPRDTKEYENEISFRLYIFNFTISAFYILVGNFRSLLLFTSMADNAICFATVLCVLILRINQQTSSPDDSPRTYRTALFNPIGFCIASGFVVVRSALRHQLQGIVLLCFFGGSFVLLKFLGFR